MQYHKNNLIHGGKIKPLCSFLGVQDIKTFPPLLHMCGYLFETFPPVLSSCSTFHLLVCSRVSLKTTRVRAAQPCGAAQIHLFLFFSFFDTWPIINGVLPLSASASENQIRCLTARNKKSPLFSWFFMRLPHHSSCLWFWPEAEGFAGLGYICAIKLKRDCHVKCHIIFYLE